MSAVAHQYDTDYLTGFNDAADGVLLSTYANEAYRKGWQKYWHEYDLLMAFFLPVEAV